MNAALAPGWGTICGPGASAGTLALLPLALPALLLTVYLFATAREVRDWPSERTASFALGCVLIAIALSPGTLDWAAADARGHMVQHLLLGMFAPIALVMGRPGTLFLRTVPTEVARGAVRVLSRPFARTIVHPFTAGLLSVGALYVLYLTPAGAALASSRAGHAWLLLHFLVAGTAFAWAVAGPDPAPHRPSYPVRLVALFLAAGAHGVLAARLGAFPVGLGPNEQAAVSIMLYGGDVAHALLALLFFRSWRRNGFARGRQKARRAGRRALGRGASDRERQLPRPVLS